MKKIFLTILITLSPVAFATSNSTAKPAVVVQRGKTQLGDLSQFKTIASDVLVLTKAKKLAEAKTRVQDLESAWDVAQPKLSSMNPKLWRTVDIAIDNVLNELRADKPQVGSSVKALNGLIQLMNSLK